jgi:hypothetical protein
MMKDESILVTKSQDEIANIKCEQLESLSYRSYLSTYSKMALTFSDIFKFIGAIILPPLGK